MVEEIVVDASLPGGLWRWLAPRVDVIVIIPPDAKKVPQTILVHEPAGRVRLEGPFVDGCEVVFTTGWGRFGSTGIRPDRVVVEQDSKIMYVEYSSRSAMPGLYMDTGVKVSYVDVAPDEPVERLRFPKDVRHSRNRKG